MRIGFIGSGNIATQLSKVLERAGHVITEVYSRTPTHAAKLCDKLYEAKVLSRPDFTQAKAEILLLCVKDDAIATLVPTIRTKANQIIAHTSGATPLSALKDIQISHGVFYPVQTFTKSKSVDFRKVPICIEASDHSTEKILEKLAHTICDHVAILDSEDRQRLHIGAVFACNFTNHLMALSHTWLSSHGIPPQILDPLITENLSKGLAQNPALYQTGPAIRKDQITIEKQLKMLEQDARLHQIYKMLTESIQTLKSK